MRLTFPSMKALKVSRLLLLHEIPASPSCHCRLHLPVRFNYAVSDGRISVRCVFFSGTVTHTLRRRSCLIIVQEAELKYLLTMMA